MTNIAKITKVTLVKIILIFNSTLCIGQDYPFELNLVLKELEEVMKRKPDSSLNLINARVLQAQKSNWLEAEINFKIFYLDALHMLNKNKQFYDSLDAFRRQREIWKNTTSKGELQHIQYFEGAMYMEEGKTLFKEGKYDACEEVCLKAKNILEQLPNIDNKIKNNIAANNNTMAGCYFRMGRHKGGEKLWEENLEIFESLGHHYNLAVTLVNLGTTAANAGELSKALDYGLKALDLCNTHDLAIKTTAVLMVSQVYFDLQEYDKALPYAIEAYKLAHKINDQYQLAYTLPEVAANYRELEQLDSAYFYYNEYLILAKEMRSTFDIASAHDELGRILMHQGDYEEALSQLRQGLSLVDDPNYMLSRLYLLTTISECLHAMNRKKEALASIKELLKITDHSESKLIRKNAYSIAHKIYETNGMHKDAYEALDLYAAYKDSTYNDEKSLELARVEYDFKLKNETQIFELEQEKKEQIHAQQLQKERLIRYGAFGSTGFALIILLILYQSFKLKKRKNWELRHKNEIIEIKNEELTQKNVEITGLRKKEKEMAEEALALKERELTTVTMFSHEKNAILQGLSEHIISLTQKVDERVIPDLEKINKIIKSNLNEKSWSEFMFQFEKVHPSFFKLLKNKYPALTQYDLRLCSYLRVGMDNKAIAQISAISLDSAKKSVYRLKKKLGLEPEQAIRNFLMSVK